MTSDDTLPEPEDDAQDTAYTSARVDQALVTRIVEAALLASNQPLTLVQLGGLFPLDEPAPEGSVGLGVVAWHGGD